MQVQSGSFAEVRNYRDYHLNLFHNTRVGSMDIDTPQPKVSTHGSRGSRREEWRKSKGLSVHAPRKEMNRQGGLAARRKAGRSKRRR